MTLLYLYLSQARDSPAIPPLTTAGVFFCPNSASVTLNPMLEGSVTEEYPNTTGSIVSSAIESSEFLNTQSMSMSQANKASDQEKDLEMKTMEGVSWCKRHD